MTQTNEHIRILNLGDIHFAHPETPTELIVNNLDREITDDILRTTDLLTIAGDVFHQLVAYNDPRIPCIEQWITTLLLRCEKYNVAVRVVEGTPYHDRNQPRYFERQKELCNINVDLRYFDKLDIEFIPSLNIHVLYVPDKWHEDTTETLREVKALLKERGLDKVDFALMHGAFSYQLPFIADEPTHDEEEYLALVRYLIFIGHVHISMVNGRIIPSGSFDRLAHGEEGPKGFHTADVNLITGNFELKFHENRNAKVYKTKTISGDDLEVFWRDVNELALTHPHGSAFALRVMKTDMIAKTIKEVQREHPEFTWKFTIEKSKKDKSKEMRSALGEEMEYLPPLTEDYLRTKVREHMEKQGVTSDKIERALALLDTVVDDG